MSRMILSSFTSKGLPGSSYLLGNKKLPTARRSVIDRCWMSSDSRTTPSLLEAIRKLDTASICDADKVVLAANRRPPLYPGIRLVGPSIKPVVSTSSSPMVGIARTVQCTRRNDFLAVFRGLLESQPGEILVVNTSDSSRAVAGELFATEGWLRRRLAGLVIDGPVRDTAQLRDLLSATGRPHDDSETPAFRIYASSVTPYSGTTQSPGETQKIVTCGGVAVHPGDVVVGDDDGIVVASAGCFEKLLPVAKEIYQTEARIREELLNGTDSLDSLTNAAEHIHSRLAKKESSLQFLITGEIIDADLERPVAFSVVRKPVSLEKQSIV